MAGISGTPNPHVNKRGTKFAAVLVEDYYGLLWLHVTEVWIRLWRNHRGPKVRVLAIVRLK